MRNYFGFPLLLMLLIGCKANIQANIEVELSSRKLVFEHETLERLYAEYAKENATLFSKIALNSNSSYARYNAAWILGAANRIEQLNTLMQVASEESPDDLARGGSIAAISLLVPQLNESDRNRVRQECSRWLRSTSPKIVRNALDVGQKVGDVDADALVIVMRNFGMESSLGEQAFQLYQHTRNASSSIALRELLRRRSLNTNRASKYIGKKSTGDE